MAKTMQIGVNDVAKNAKDIYIGVNNVAKKAVRAYIGVNNVAKLFWEKGETVPVDAVIRFYEGTNGRLSIGVGYNKASKYRRVADSGMIYARFIYRDDEKWWYTNNVSLFSFKDDSTAITEDAKINYAHWVGILDGMPFEYHYQGNNRYFRAYRFTDFVRYAYQLDIKGPVADALGDDITIADVRIWQGYIAKPNNRYAIMLKGSKTVEDVKTYIPFIIEFTFTAENGFSDAVVTPVPDIPEGGENFTGLTTDLRNFFAFWYTGDYTRQMYITDGVHTYAHGRIPVSNAQTYFFKTEDRIYILSYRDIAGGPLILSYTSRSNPSLPFTQVERSDITYGSNDRAMACWNYDGTYYYGSDKGGRLYRSLDTETWTLAPVGPETTKASNWAYYWLKTETGMYESTN